VTARLVTPEVQLQVSKPGKSNQLLRLQLTAEGEGDLRCSYAVEAALLRRSPLGRFEEVKRSPGTWPLRNWSMTAFGTRFAWLTQPGIESVFSLDPTKQVFSAQEEHEFSVGVDCSAGPVVCPADGDRIVTTVRVQSAAVGPTTGISITSDIVSIPSCNLSRADLLLYENSATVQVKVMDADNLSVGFSTPELLADWDLASDVGSSASNTTAAGERIGPLVLTRVLSSDTPNLFSANIPKERRTSSGVYRLRVRLANGWASGVKGIVPECILLERAVPIGEEGQVNTIVVLGASAGACALLVLGLTMLIRRNKKQLEHVMTTLITEVAKMIFTFVFEILDVALDIFCFYRAVVTDTMGATYSFQVAYCTLALSSHPFPSMRTPTLPSKLGTITEHNVPAMDSSQNLQVAYCALTAVAAVLSLVAIGYRLHLFWLVRKATVQLTRATSPRVHPIGTAAPAMPESETPPTRCDIRSSEGLV